MTFFPHLLNLLSKKQVRASMRFSQLRRGSPDRKALARELHGEVLRLREAAHEPFQNCLFPLCPLTGYTFGLWHARRPYR